MWLSNALQYCGLGPLSTVTAMHLSGEWLTDEVLDPLAELRGLRLLTLTGSRISPEGLRQLSSRLPRCRIRHWKENSDSERVDFLTSLPNTGLLPLPRLRAREDGAGK